MCLNWLKVILDKLLMITKTLNDFYNLIKGKNVAVIGPAAYLVKKRYGRAFDKFDIVIRFKRSYPVNPVRHLDYGYKTHLLFTNLKSYVTQKLFHSNNFSYKNFISMTEENVELVAHFPINLFPFSKFKKCFFLHPREERRTKKKRNHHGYLIEDKKFDKLVYYDNFITNEDYEKFKIELNGYGRQDSTVFSLALHYLSKSEAKKIMISGFDFRKGGYIDEYKNKKADQVSKEKTVNSHVHNLDNEIYYFKKNVINDERIIIDKFIHKLFFNEDPNLLLRVL